MKSIVNLSAGLAAFALSGAALAHPGHDAASFALGFSHPFTGPDHLLAMFAVGLWAAQAGGRAVYSMPLAFVAAMLAGALLSLSGAVTLVPAAVESLIAASVLALGLLVSLRAGAATATALAAVFALFHGMAHGSELGVAAAAAYVPGFVLATLALHGLGMVLGLALRGSRMGARAAGLPIALTGAAFLVQALAA